MKITEISNTGLVTIQFSEDFYIPTNSSDPDYFSYENITTDILEIITINPTSDTA
jgi:hypothetical protein